MKKACETCGSMFHVKPSRVERSRYCSVPCKHKGLTALTGAVRYNFKGPSKMMACEVCGTERLVRYSMQVRYRACSKACASELGRRAWPRTSSLEAAMSEAFASAGLSPIAQMTVGPFSADFGFPSARLIVECDGSYWHGRAEQQRRDNRKDGWLHANGWRVLRLSETDITASPMACVDRVWDALNHGYTPITFGANALTHLG